MENVFNVNALSALKTLPYGAWESPLSPDLLTRGAVSLGAPVACSNRVYWTEQRPWEAGRTALVVQTPDGKRKDLTPEPYNVRSRVHEYGGSAFTVHDDVVWFVDGGDNRVHRIDADGSIHAVTQASKRAFAELTYDPNHGRLIAVCEDHSPDGEPENSLVEITAKGAVRPLVAGADFYAFPCLSPSGNEIAWIEWRHPNMPWDGTVLKTGLIDDEGNVIDPLCLAGQETSDAPNQESVFQPRWGTDGSLTYVSDRSGFWNLFLAGEEERHYKLEAEFGVPLWQLGMSTYTRVGTDKIICCYAVEGDWRLGELNLHTGDLKNIEGPWVEFSGLTSEGDTVYFNGGRPDAPDELVQLNSAEGGWRVLRKSSEIIFEAGGVSVAEPIQFPTQKGRTAYANLYLPANHIYDAPDGELPPLIVKSHGGPTGQSGRGLSLKIQYWTSRGFAVVDVNYGGSAGYGRAYRERLNGTWGIVDVEDCVNAAQYLAAKGLVDLERMAISGGSAGGYTTLCALTFHSVFKAGCSSYGVGDLEALARDTHKFESRYVDRLVGLWPQAVETYRARSPIHHTEKLSCPVIFLQGADDKVVPPNQAEEMVAALDEKGLPVAYILFEEEGHGFRRAENVKKALEAELSFYGQVFGFNPAGRIPRIEIKNG